MDVPEFMTKEERKPHLYLMPRYASSKIVTNIDSKVRLEYSKADAGLGGSCSAEEHHSHGTCNGGIGDHDIIRVDASQGVIHTQDNYGKATVVIEDVGKRNHIVMLNILITRIFSLVVENSFGALSLPLGS